MAEENIKDCKLSIVDSTVDSFNKISNTIDEQLAKLEGLPQEVVDDVIVNEINPTMTEICKDIRANLIDTLHEMYESNQSEKSKMSPLNIDLSGIDVTKFKDLVTFVMDLKDFVMQVYQDLIAFTPKLLQHISKLNSAVNELTKSRKPNFGNINYDKLDIKIEPISISDITGK